MTVITAVLPIVVASAAVRASGVCEHRRACEQYRECDQQFLHDLVLDEPRGTRGCDWPSLMRQRMDCAPRGSQCPEVELTNPFTFTRVD